MSNFVIQTSHPIQRRAQTFTLDRKILSIHSFDRDISKWPNSNYFEIDLPEAAANIQSIRLVQIGLPSNQFVFSNEYQNTKLSFVHQATTTNPPPYGGTICNIIISEGSYTSQELAIEIASKMNLAAYNDPNGIIGPPPQQYLCKYNDILNTFWFGNTADKFVLLFSKQEIYTGLCNQPLVWKHYTRWGLPAYLGYKRNDYICEPTTNNTNGYVVGGTTGASYGFSYEWENSSSIPPFNVWLGNGITGALGTSGAQFVDATKPLVFAGVTGGTRDESGVCQIDIFGEQAIYMELDKFNSIDEMEPYSENTMGIYNNDLNGKVKAAFAKIPILQTQFTQQTDNVNNNLMNISHYDPVIERIDRLRFKFRYHDGRLVDFRCVPFNFSIEFNCLRDRQDKKMAIFVPPLYNV
tara:strand:- start:1350 stop:2576 length:1227 start_codon:yes stop_codon:yes gene_type:complete